ncbi:MAG: FeoA family protein [candidate division FCPU426 bacterium]
MSPWKTKNGVETLDNLRPGFSAAVLEVLDRDRHDTRLQEIGIVPGAQVEVLATGTTMLVRVGEQRLSLRKEAAEAVTVYPSC